MSNQIIMTAYELNEAIMEWIASYRPNVAKEGDLVVLKSINKKTGNVTIEVEDNKE